MTGQLPRSALAGLGWGPALRIALRELRRAPGRTLLVVVMVLLPVTAVVALDTLLRTGEIDVVEGLPRDLGDAQARIDVEYPNGPVQQTPDGNFNGGYAGTTPPARVDPADVRAALPDGTRLLEVRNTYRQTRVETADGQGVSVDLVGVDLSDPATRGPYVLLRGEAPDAPDEVAVTPQVERAGFPAGSSMVLPGGREVTVTGTALYPRAYGSPRGLLGDPTTLGIAQTPLTQLYAHGPEVTWDDVRELNALGAVVLSRSVVLDPPPEDQVPDVSSSAIDGQAVAVIGLIVIIAVLEVVLLAGPAFAVGARRQRRSLALLAASGGEPRHVRRVVLAQGLLVGGVAGVLGAVLGVAVAAAARAPLTRWFGAVWGPFEVSVRDVVLLGLLGAVTAVLAALLPAVLAARQPVVDSLRGRRTSGAGTPAPTAAGLALLLLGVLLCITSLDGRSPDLTIAFAALPTVVGAVLLAPVLLRAQGRLAGRLPLALRYAVRDADRQRSRTAPAVAAVAATVAAAFALGTASSSDARQTRETWSPAGPPGAAVVTAWSREGADWPAVQAAARRALPGERVVPVSGLALSVEDGDGSFEELQLCRPTAAAGTCEPTATTSYGAALGSSVLVGAQAVDLLAPLLEQGSAVAARRALAAGAVVVFSPTDDPVELRRQRLTPPADGGATAVRVLARASAPAVVVRAAEPAAPALAVVGDDLARRLGGAATVALVVGDELTRAQESRLRDAVSIVDAGTSTSVERGPEDGTGLVLLLLVLGAGTLVLAGTFAATSLALVEAQPDFAVLGQVGARPRARRTLAGAYAAVLALSGAVLGVVAGAVPGVTAALALTRTTSDVSNLPGEQLPSAWAYVTVPPLLLVALLVVLPLLAGALAALTARGAPTSAPGRRAA